MANINGFLLFLNTLKEVAKELGIDPDKQGVSKLNNYVFSKTEPGIIIAKAKSDEQRQTLVNQLKSLAKRGVFKNHPKWQEAYLEKNSQTK